MFCSIDKSVILFSKLYFTMQVCWWSLSFCLISVTSRSCSKAPAVNPDCSNHLVNIMRATVCICDQPLCNGLNAVANFSTLNSRIFSNTNINNLVTNNNQQNNNKENFMPLHDFNEQRMAAILGTNGVSKQVMTSSWTSLSTIFLFTLIIAMK